LKCRPPNNRNSLPEEITACTPYLNQQVSMLRPRVIATLGNFAASYAFKRFGFEEKSIGWIHGKIFRVKTLLDDTSIVPLYHPAAAVYNPGLKGTLLEDTAVIGRMLE